MYCWPFTRMRRIGPPSVGGSGWSIEANCPAAALSPFGPEPGGSYGPADLERRIAADLVGAAVAAGAVLDQRPDQDPPHQQEDHDPDVERDLVQRVDVVRVLRPARLGRERVRKRRRSGDQDAEDDRAEGDEEQPSWHAGGQGGVIISLGPEAAPLRAGCAERPALRQGPDGPIPASVLD